MYRLNSFEPKSWSPSINLHDLLIYVLDFNFVRIKITTNSSTIDKKNTLDARSAVFNYHYYD